MSSEFRQKLRQVLPTGEEKDKIQAEFGVDIEKDIDTVAAAYLGGAPRPDGARDRPRPFQHRPDRGLGHRSTARRPSDYKGKRMLTCPRPRHATRRRPARAITRAAAWRSSSSACWHSAKSPALKPAIDAAETGHDIRKNTELMKIVNDVRGAGQCVVRRQVRRDYAATTRIPDELKSRIPAVNTFAVSVHVNGGAPRRDSRGCAGRQGRRAAARRRARRAGRRPAHVGTEPARWTRCSSRCRSRAAARPSA